MSRRQLTQIFFAASCLVWSAGIYAQDSLSRAWEERLRQKLDRIFSSDEYLLDVQIHSTAADREAAGSFLPGLELLGPLADLQSSLGQQALPANLKGEVLLILDRGVSRERVSVAEDLIRRILKSEETAGQLQIQVKQQSIQKPLPAPPPPPPVQREPSVFEHIQANRELVLKGLIVLWASLLSLMGGHFLLKRLLIPPDQKHPGREREPSSASAGSSPAASPQSASTSAPQRLAARKDELYSKDQATHKIIEEIIATGKAEPKKIAKILGKWVAQSSENGRFAAVFLKNCDLSTIEKVCSLLHPSDLEKILAYPIEDFDPFSDLNQRVIERMRSELAISASEIALGTRPEPLDFLRLLSDDDLAALLRQEDPKSLALVATQIPNHRLLKFYSELSSSVLGELMHEISRLDSPQITEFDSLRDRLAMKANVLASSLFPEKSRIQTILHLVESLGAPDLQIELMRKLRIDNPSVYEAVRPQILLASDLNFISSRVLTVLTQSLDPTLMAQIFKNLDLDMSRLFAQLSETYHTVMHDSMAREIDSHAIIAAWSEARRILKDAVATGLLTQSELVTAIQKAEEDLNRSELVAA